MTIITNQEHQYNADMDATEKIEIYINGVKAIEYIVGVGNEAKITFLYQEILIV